MTNPSHTKDLDERFNIQDTKELEYFQKIQVQKQEIKSLNMRIGQLQAEIDHLNFRLEKAYEPLSNRQVLKKKYDELMCRFVKYQESYPKTNPPSYGKRL
jgi:flagellar biosynthesis chaperone FliJ